MTSHVGLVVVCSLRMLRLRSIKFAGLILSCVLRLAVKGYYSTFSCMNVGCTVCGVDRIHSAAIKSLRIAFGYTFSLK